MGLPTDVCADSIDVRTDSSGDAPTGFDVSLAQFNHVSKSAKWQWSNMQHQSKQVCTQQQDEGVTLQQHTAHKGRPHAQHVHAHSLRAPNVRKRKEACCYGDQYKLVTETNWFPRGSQARTSWLLSAQSWKLFAHAKTDNHTTPCNIISAKDSQRNWLTNELLVPNVQSHVPQSCGHGTNHPVIVYPQQLHQDRKTLLFTNCSTDIDGPLDRAEGRVWILFSWFLVHFELLMILDSYWSVMGLCKDWLAKC